MDIAEICEGRPQLKRMMSYQLIEQVWVLNDDPLDFNAAKAREKTLILLAESYNGSKFVVQDIVGKKEDKCFWWIAPKMLKPDGYIFISKEKVGRKRLALTDEERQRIHDMRESGMSINGIAAEMRISNRRVMQCVKELSCT